jgi:hypothetical protein
VVGVAQWSYEWDTTSVPDGMHTVVVTAIDAFENRRDAILCCTVDNTQPVIAVSQEAAYVVDHQAVNIVWTTSLPTMSQVEYGLTAAYGTRTTQDIYLVNSHRVQLTGLQPNTTYHYRTISRAAGGRSVASADHTFKTPPPAVVISNVNTAVACRLVTITWTTDVPADTRLWWSSDGKAFFFRSDATLTLQHSISSLPLQEQKVYYYYIGSANSQGKLVKLPVETVTTPACEKNPPTVTIDPVPAACSGTVTLTGTASDDTKVSWVGVSIDQGAFTKATGTGPWSFAWDTTTYSTSYGLATLTAAAIDAYDNFSKATVTCQVDNRLVISQVSAQTGTCESATVSWNTSGDGDTLVEYGPTGAYGSASPLDATMTTSHAVTLSGLTAGTYHYRVVSKDRFGVAVSSQDGTFVAAACPLPDTSLAGCPASPTSAAAATLTFAESSGLAIQPPVRFECVVDGGAPAACTSPFQWSLSDGAHRFAVTAVDGGSRRDPSPASCQVTVDQTPPSVGPISVVGVSGAFVPGAFSFSAPVTDVEGVASCESTIDGAAWEPASLVNGVCTGAAQGLADRQPVSLNLRGRDRAGNVGIGAAVSRTVDTVAPVTTDNAPQTWQPGDVTVTLAATDAGAGVASTAWCEGPGCAPSQITNPFTIACPAGTVCNSAFSYRSTDLVGNVELLRGGVVRIDRQAPTGGSVAYAQTAAKRITVSFVNGTDSGSGIVRRLIQKRVAAYAKRNCGPFGGWADWRLNPAGTSAVDTVTTGCYQYQYAVTDGVGNTTVYASPAVVIIK